MSDWTSLWTSTWTVLWTRLWTSYELVCEVNQWINNTQQIQYKLISWGCSKHCSSNALNAFFVATASASAVASSTDISAVSNSWCMSSSSWIAIPHARQRGSRDLLQDVLAWQRRRASRASRSRRTLWGLCCWIKYSNQFLFRLPNNNNKNNYHSSETNVKNEFEVWAWWVNFVSLMAM